LGVFKNNAMSFMSLSEIARALPRPDGRSVISNTCMIDQGILEKTLEFAHDEWHYPAI
jgi:hypothetical protein